MKICANCFADDEIKNYILSSSSEISICDCCGAEGIAIELSELSDFFVSLLSLYVQDDNSETELYAIIEQDWHIFSSIDNACKVLSALFSQNYVQLDFDSNVRYIDEIFECHLAWQKLKSDVRNKSRFFSDVASFNWDSYIRPNYTLRKGSVLFRARIIPENKKRLTPKDMGCPPPHKATAGRANPLGIPYLYLCENEETTLYETRSVYLDKVAIGRFKIERDLRIVNFDELINLFYAYTTSDTDTALTEIVKQRMILDIISKDMSKPLRRFDTELEYIPTQLICEYCKQNNADGIKFTSSLFPKGSNIVLFNPKDAKCTKVDTIEIANVSIRYK